ncbi:methyl-accepting chemotaxis protein [Bordetella pertussis]|nr:methyl-accepting chemotaxis protein [Bordetella pertussis]
MRKKLKLAAALSATLAFFVLLFAAAAGAGVAVLRDNQAAIEALGRGNIERASDLGDTTSWLFQARAVLADAKTYMEGGLEEQRDAALAQAATLLEQVRASQERLRANPEMAAQGASLYDEVLAGYDALAVQALAPLHAALKGWNGIEANRLAERALPQAAERYIEAVDAFQGYAREQGRAAVADAARVLERMVLGAAALLALVAVLAVVIRLGFRRAMLRPLTEAGRHFDRIADGDLTAAIAARGDNEIGALYSAMRASMAELAGTVRATAEHADQASRQAAGATELARQGGTAVAQVVASMRDIASGAQRIAEIVGLVDSLAFQTNVLALNAAVEAARAGPQGRGFAVVAGEVRSLAQRSAQAAREIKGLIDDSSARVASGVQQVNLAGATMGEIVQSIDRVTQLVAGISEASATQAAGIASVNLAVADAERATQENAAMAEQTAAAAASLEAQAQALRQAVAVFRLAGAAPRSGGAGGQLVALDQQRQVAVLDLLLDAGGGRGEVLRANVAA